MSLPETRQPIAVRPHLLPSAILTVITIPIIVLEALRWVQATGPVGSIDFYLFGPTGGNLLTGHWASVYSDPRNQAGPFELITYGSAYLLHIHTVVGWVIFFTVVSTILAFAAILVLSIVRGTAPRTPSWFLALAVCALVVVASYIPSAVFLGHPADIAIPLLWLVAGLLARGRFFVACGVVIALSAGWEVWGVLGAPVILLVTKPGLVRAALGGIAGLVVLFVPFIATGVFAMFRFNWPIESNSVFHALTPALTDFPWSLRLVQAVVAVGAGCAVALLTRASRYAIWLVPIAILAFRLSLDPVLAQYYWYAAAIVAIGLLAHLVQERRWILAFAAALAVAAFATPLANFIGAIVFAILTLAVAILVYVHRSRASLTV